jgi:alkaline phosphatase D
MEASRNFHTPPLERMVALGRVTERSARIWLRSPRYGGVTTRFWREGDEGSGAEASVVIPPEDPADGTAVIDLPPSQLAPGTSYQYRVTHEDGSFIGEGAFQTVPEARQWETGKVLRIGVYSCHQPFDPKGKIRPDAGRMLKAMASYFDENPVVALFEAGDQMYTDEPAGLSLFDESHFRAVAPPGRRDILECTAPEVRQLLNRRYRLFWNLPEWQTLHARFPCYPTWDDHEMVDNWRSVEEHLSEKWGAFAEGGRASFHDYQMSRILGPAPFGELPSSLHYSWEYGPMAAFVMDLRSERRGGEDGRLMSDRQFQELAAFLEGHHDRPLLMVVLSVPIVHLPRNLARIAARVVPFVKDFSDRWVAGGFIRDRDRVIELLYRYQDAHPGQRVVLLSGDIHIGCVHHLHFRHGGIGLYQFISSGITHASSALVQWASKAVIRRNRFLKVGERGIEMDIEFVSGTPGHLANPCGGLNCGVLEARQPAPEKAPQIRFQLMNEREGRLFPAYESPWL